MNLITLKTLSYHSDDNGIFVIVIAFLLSFDMVLNVSFVGNLNVECAKGELNVALWYRTCVLKVIPFSHLDNIVFKQRFEEHEHCMIGENGTIV